MTTLNDRTLKVQKFIPPQARELIKKGDYDGWLGDKPDPQHWKYSVYRFAYLQGLKQHYDEIYLK